MNAVVGLLLVSAAMAVADQPITRTSVEVIERGFDRTLGAIDPNDPVDVLGLTRGLYLDNYGMIFTAEINLVVTPVSPFHPPPDAAGLGNLHRKKQQRLVILKEAMRKAVLEVATKLNGMPPDEQVMIAVTLLYRSFEKRDDLPDQVLVHAPLKTLIDIKAGRAAASVIRVEER